MSEHTESQLARVYRITYEKLCGKHPVLLPWHFQYLDTVYLYRSLKQLLPKFATGVVLDVGCGDGPCQSWCVKAEQYIGIDTFPGVGVTHLIDGHSPWPLPDRSIDTIICTQVLEHVEDMRHVLSEMDRVLKGGG